MTPIEEWLGSLGLSEYADRFAENRIDLSILQDLTDQDLKDIGASLMCDAGNSPNPENLIIVTRPQWALGRGKAHGAPAIY